MPEAFESCRSDLDLLKKGTNASLLMAHYLKATKLDNDARDALRVLGVGGKTRAGYGRMKRVRPTQQITQPNNQEINEQGNNEPKIVIADFVKMDRGKPRFKVDGKPATFDPPVIPQRGQRQFKAIVVREDANSYGTEAGRRKMILYPARPPGGDSF